MTTSSKEIKARENLILYLSRVLFGDGYDEAIDRAKSLARNESIWPTPRKKKRRRESGDD